MSPTFWEFAASSRPTCHKSENFLNALNLWNSDAFLDVNSSPIIKNKDKL